MIALLSLVMLALTLFMYVRNNTLGMIVCGLLLLGIAGWNVVRSLTSSPNAPSIQFVEMDRQVMTSVLAKKLAARYPAARVAIVVAPSSGPSPLGGGPPSDVPKRLAAALKALDVDVQTIPAPASILSKSFQDAAAEVDLPEEEAAVPLYARLQHGFHAGHLNALSRHFKSEADVLICTLNIVPEFAPSGLLKRGQGPHLVLMSVPAEAEPEVQASFASTVLDAVLVYQADVDWNVDQAWPKDPV